MDHFFNEHSPEHAAQAHIAAYVFWDANIGPNDIGLCAAYASLARFVRGEDLYIPPRNDKELQQILRNYSDHVVNSLGSQVKSRLAQAGYARARDVSAKSLRSVLTPEKVAELLAMHTSPDDEQTSTTNQADGLEPSEPMPPIQSN